MRICEYANPMRETSHFKQQRFSPHHVNHSSPFFHLVNQSGFVEKHRSRENYHKNCCLCMKLFRDNEQTFFYIHTTCCCASPHCSHIFCCCCYYMTYNLTFCKEQKKNNFRPSFTWVLVTRHLRVYRKQVPIENYWVVVWRMLSTWFRVCRDELWESEKLSTRQRRCN